MPFGILRLGSHLPDTVIDNDDIAAWTGASPDWVVERTGVRTRRYAGEDTATSELAELAVRDLLRGHTDSPERIGLIVLATCTPDQPQPATAARMQSRLGLGPTASFDINAVCTGFLYGLDCARGMLESDPGLEQALVVGADKFSSVMDRSDKRTVSLFGDGAGAALVGEVPEGYGIHTTAMTSDGSSADLVGVDAGGTAMPTTPRTADEGRDKLRMQGREVRGWAMENVPKLVDDALERTGWDAGSVDRVVFHQANVRMLEELCDAVGIDADKAPMTAPEYGNTAVASIPVTLHASHHARPLRRGERVLLAAVGGGMTAGAVTLTWY
jgi:3-oxoacyl-[acyl-carrier-protein] synthase-3